MNTPTTILITDTGIWIDLNHGGILQEFFQLPYRIVTPDFVTQRELRRPSWKTLYKMGLEIVELEPDQVLELYSLKQQYSSLSAADLATLIVARNMGGILLTGDSLLRARAEDAAIPVHGILWVLDTLLRFDLLNTKDACKSLLSMKAKGAFLPEEEVQERYQRWST
jgi:predicted nucleic acid-binding protein